MEGLCERSCFGVSFVTRGTGDNGHFEGRVCVSFCVTDLVSGVQFHGLVNTIARTGVCIDFYYYYGLLRNRVSEL